MAIERWSGEIDELLATKASQATRVMIPEKPFCYLGTYYRLKPNWEKLEETFTALGIKGKRVQIFTDPNTRNSLDSLSEGANYVWVINLQEGIREEYSEYPPEQGLQLTLNCDLLHELCELGFALMHQRRTEYDFPPDIYREEDSMSERYAKQEIAINGAVWLTLVPIDPNLPSLLANK